jgi:hydrogenase expression/formation protein HypC
MCLAIPAKIKQLISETKALIEVGGIEKDIALNLLNEPVAVGDFVIVHVGFALTKLNHEEAEKTLQLLQQLQEMKL